MGEARLLDGLRVVDLTEGYGSLAGRVLADLGAEVVRAEFDGGRDIAPRTSDGIGLHHLVRNVGKVSIDVDVDALGPVLDGADLVLVSSATPAALAADRLREAHPDVVVVSVTSFGLAGACADWQGTELVDQCLAGLTYKSGVPELPPLAAPSHHTEDMGAVHAVFAALLALRQRSHDGRGRLIDVSSVLAQAQATDMALPLWSRLHMLQTRQGAGAYPLFDCVDGVVRLVLPMSPKEWRDLIAWLGSPPDWTGGGWDEPMLGPDERAVIVEAVAERCASATRDELEASAGPANVRMTSVLTPAELLVCEHTRERGTFTPIAIDGGRTAAVHAGMFSVDGERCATSGAMRAGPVPDWPRRVISPRSTNDDALPLAGLRVIEIGTGVAAPEGARLFADWGADVIKIEHRDRPDFQRMVMGGEMNPAFITVARNKRVFGVDLATERGRELLLDLIDSTDVVMENNATGVLERLGIGWDILRARNPRLILVDTQLFGDRGPWSHRKGYGPSARAIGGLTWLWAHGPDQPRGVMSIHPDHLGGRLVAIAALAALAARDRDGVGRRVDVAQFEAVAALIADVLALESLEPGAGVPIGNVDADHAPWGVYRCADVDGAESWLAVCVRDDRDWTALRRLADGALDGGGAWDHESGRVLDRERVDAAVAGWLRSLDAADLESRLQVAGVPAGRALHPALLAEHPLVTSRRFCVEVDQPGYGPVILEGPAFVAEAMGPERTGPAPALGEHTAEIAREICGLDDEEIALLVGIGVLDHPSAPV